MAQIPEIETILHDLADWSLNLASIYQNRRKIILMMRLCPQDVTATMDVLLTSHNAA